MRRHAFARQNEARGLDAGDGRRVRAFCGRARGLQVETKISKAQGLSLPRRKIRSCELHTAKLRTGGYAPTYALSGSAADAGSSTSAASPASIITGCGTSTPPTRRGSPSAEDLRGHGRVTLSTRRASLEMLAADASRVTRSSESVDGGFRGWGGRPALRRVSAAHRPRALGDEVIINTQARELSSRVDGFDVTIAA